VPSSCLDAPDARRSGRLISKLPRAQGMRRRAWSLCPQGGSELSRARRATRTSSRMWESGISRAVIGIATATTSEPGCGSNPQTANALGLGPRSSSLAISHQHRRESRLTLSRFGVRAPFEQEGARSRIAVLAFRLSVDHEWAEQLRGQTSESLGSSRGSSLIAPKGLVLSRQATSCPFCAHAAEKSGRGGEPDPHGPEG